MPHVPQEEPTNRDKNAIGLTVGKQAGHDPRPNRRNRPDVAIPSRIDRAQNSTA